MMSTELFNFFIKKFQIKKYIIQTYFGIKFCCFTPTFRDSFAPVKFFSISGILDKFYDINLITAMKVKWMERELKPDKKRTCQALWKSVQFMKHKYCFSASNFSRSSYKYSNGQGEKGKGVPINPCIWCNIQETWDLDNSSR